MIDPSVPTFDPEIKHHFGGGVYAKEILIPTGHTIIQHVHRYDHLSVLASGSVLVLVDNVVSEYHAPACINISAGKMHAVEAITEAVWYCVHATDCEDVDEIDKQLIEVVPCQ